MNELSIQYIENYKILFKKIEREFDLEDNTSLTKMTFLIKNPKLYKIKKIYEEGDIYFPYINYQIIEYENSVFQCSCPYYRRLEKICRNPDKYRKRYMEENIDSYPTRKRAEEHINKIFKGFEYSIDSISCPHIHSVKITILEFKINEYIKLKLQKDITMIYVSNQKFMHCKYLLFINPNEEIQKEIHSIDEAKEYLNSEEEGLEDDVFLIPKISPKEEFWGHCSNLQAWAENDYDTRILHSNLAFPLLKRLTEAGDKKAKRVFKDEIIKRIEAGFKPTIEFLQRGDYLSEAVFTKEELKILKKLLLKQDIQL